MTPFLAAYLTVLAFFFGICVGSFLNVCIYRIPLEESVIHPRSHCPQCGKMIAWYDNIPLFSYLALRAKCRHCGLHIPVRYFMVELLTGVLFLLVWNRYGLALETPAYWLVMSGLVLGTFVDFDHMIIPDRVSLGGMLAGLVCSTLAPSLQGEDLWYRGAMYSAIGIAAGSGSLWCIGLLGKLAFKKDAMGMGDVKLLGGMGAFFGWESVIFIIMVSSLIGSVFGVFLIVSRSKDWQSRIPYGPYLALAAVAWMLGGNGMWQMYVRWLTGE